MSKKYTVNRSKRVLNPPGMPAGDTKICTQCQQEKPLSEFYKEPKQNSSGYRSWCKECCRQHSKARYDAYDDPRHYSAARLAAKHELKRQLVVKLGRRCTQCGYNKSIHALDFHHIGEGKEYNISDLLLRATSRDGKHLERLYAEVEKCILLCANCHRELHAGEL